MPLSPGISPRTLWVAPIVRTGPALLEQVDVAIAAGFAGTPLATKRIVKAAQFAADRHRKQIRKGPKRLPYIVHPIDVAVRLLWAGQDEDTICAGLLHDVIEDCGVEPLEIATVIGMRVAQMVLQVTNVTKPTPGMNRNERQAIEREHLSRAWPEMKNLKLVDTYCNARDIVQDEPKFAPTYLAEKRLLLPVLEKGSHPVLYQLAAEAVGLAA
jgi:(p)ppGpp synthase/HD superfamily hydrolase